MSEMGGKWAGSFRGDNRFDVKQRMAVLGLILLVGACGPKPTYAEGCGPLPKGWITPHQGRGVLSILSVVSVKTGGTLSWNGGTVTEPALRDYLELTGELNPIPVTQIKFDPSIDCDTVRRLRQLMVQTLDCSNGRCAEGSGKWRFLGDVVGPGISPEPFELDVSPTPGDPRS